MSSSLVRPARAFSYVVAHDAGFAPSPFHGWCSLACCKPLVRRQARPGDLVVGLSNRCASIVYVLKVEERLTFEEYWEDPRFAKKRPDWDAERLVHRCGDNIYRPDGRGGFTQIRSCHWDHARDRESLAMKRRDTSVNAVLAGRTFVYFGSGGPPLPDELDFLRVTRGHRSRFTDEELALVHEFFDSLPRGIHGRPARWSESDDSWRTSCASS